MFSLVFVNGNNFSLHLILQCFCADVAQLYFAFSHLHKCQVCPPAGKAGEVLATVPARIQVQHNLSYIGVFNEEQVADEETPSVTLATSDTVAGSLWEASGPLISSEAG